MSLYINTQTNEYPIYIGDLILVNVNPDDLPDHIHEVAIEIPEYDEKTETIYEEAPIKDENGKYHAVIKVRAKTQKEIDEYLRGPIRVKVACHQPITEEEAQLLINI